jgi:antitoxin component of MazEF toxin-antitoxin module
MRKKVTAVGTSAAIILSKDLLAQMQIGIGVNKVIESQQKNKIWVCKQIKLEAIMIIQ